ncbi:hypothetical protein K0M31_004392 [Melipona bicolor]|uniref:BTB domain-containing protein n=1 Tax=Melipona bicolor TaxID=60889 RepID=A0AA40KNB2_9HYME|nr:hypothetical protein K0M31_004392 [Melipona bicolor]
MEEFEEYNLNNVMATRVMTTGSVSGLSGEAGLAGVPRLLEDLARLSEDKDTADIVFLLGRDETPIYAHRIILQASRYRFPWRPDVRDTRARQITPVTNTLTPHKAREILAIPVFSQRNQRKRKVGGKVGDETMDPVVSQKLEN